MVAAGQWCRRQSARKVLELYSQAMTFIPTPRLVPELFLSVKGAFTCLYVKAVGAALSYRLMPFTAPIRGTERPFPWI